MGIYLSQPSTDINLETGAQQSLAFAVGEMQGWRKTMEDAHIAEINVAKVDLNEAGRNAVPVSIFGVFDGHGGKEVAKFTKLKYAEVLLNSEAFQTRDFHRALKTSFHRIDELLEDPQYDALLKELRALPNPSELSSAVKMTNSKSTTLTPSTSSSATADKDEPLSSSEAIKLIRNLLADKSSLKTQGQTSPSQIIDAEEELMDDKPSPKQNDSNNSSSSKDASKGSDDKNSTSLVVIPESKSRGDEEKDDYKSEGKYEDKSSNVSDNALVVVKEKDLEHPHLPVERPPEPAPPAPPAEPRPASIINSSTGQKVCNLLNHRVLAGCTAIVALMVGDRLYVANAGDSRGVLSRRGIAIALSEDHKPRDVRELQRIESAGGFVNAVGRINGNLNLSRSLGDLKYKALKHLPVEAQIITAEPDIREFELSADDEFIVLGCDGIWDVLSNQQAVDFVRERLQRGESLEEITKAALHRCLADNPSASQGIGADNMTFLVVSLQAVLPARDDDEQRMSREMDTLTVDSQDDHKQDDTL